MDNIKTYKPENINDLKIILKELLESRNNLISIGKFETPFNKYFLNVVTNFSNITLHDNKYTIEEYKNSIVITNDRMKISIKNTGFIHINVMEM